MKSLEHLPEQKQLEILEILTIILEEANPEKVILFGSHARQNWVDDEYVEDGIRFSYISDYDFLIVIDKKEAQEREHAIISHIENRTIHIRNAVSPIVHDIEYVNQGLRFGQYFFTDIVKEGVLLYDRQRQQFATPVHLTPQEEREKAHGYFNMWFPRACEFLDIAKSCLQKGQLSMGAFQLHQAAECFYNAVLLVFTGYKPKTHNLQKLRNYAKHISVELYCVFKTPQEDEREYHLFDLLKRGYIDARYNLDYYITSDELDALVTKVTSIKEIIEKLCQEKINFAI